MRDPKRVLKKLLGSDTDIEPFDATGESLEQAVETFRDVAQCRKIRDFIKNSFGIDLAISPQTFYQLLEIGAINYIETTQRDLEVETVSLKDTRQPDDTVSIGNLNSVLRELYRDLQLLHERIHKDFPDALLLRDMRPELIDRCLDFADRLETLHGKFFTGGKVRKIEKEFATLFPNSPNARPMQSKFLLVRNEMELYQSVLRTEKKWQALDLDLFAILRANDANDLRLLLKNAQEMGNRLWQIIYESSEIKKCLELLGIDFANIHPLFNNQIVPLSNH
jgi:hypothetical protein